VSLVVAALLLLYIIISETNQFKMAEEMYNRLLKVDASLFSFASKAWKSYSKADFPIMSSVSLEIHLVMSITEVS